MLSRDQLRTSLDKLEAGRAAGAVISAEALRSLKPAARHWAEQSRQLKPLLRLARLCGAAGYHRDAIEFFEAALAIDATDPRPKVGLASALEATGEIDRAQEIIDRLLVDPTLSGFPLKDAVSLASKLRVAPITRILSRFETDLAAGKAVSSADLNAVKDSARECAHLTRQPAPLRLLARLFRTIGELDEALALNRAACAIDPLDMWSAVGLATTLDALGNPGGAIEALQPLLQQSDVDVAVLASAAQLSRKLGDTQGALALRRAAADRDPRQLAGLIKELIAANFTADAVTEARRALAGRFSEPELMFRCYTTLSKFSSDVSEIALALSALRELAAERDEKFFWEARLHRWNGQEDNALDAISAAVSKRPNDIRLRRERASIALSVGHWGRDAHVLLDGIAVAPDAGDLKAGIKSADELLRAFGGSLEAAAAKPTAFAHVRNPESVFDHVVDGEAMVDACPSKRQGVAMIASSLAAGGAERILAVSFNHIRRDPRFGWAKLYLFDLSSETAKDFYLPLTGLSRSEVTLLERSADMKQPLAWLGGGPARAAQAIFDQLLQDRPATVHAWLEPLTLYAGLAAILAGVPNIVLHSHNMCPPVLNTRDPFSHRMQHCYRSLLRRPEVRLLCCAEAAARDYREWIGVSDKTKVLTLHNGLDVTQWDSPGNQPSIRNLHPSPTTDSETPLVGTAFRFCAVKRPLLWVNAAALVLAKRPDCRFVMYGEGELRAATAEYIRNRGLSESFSLPGLVSNLHSHLPNLDVFVLSSRTEALPNVLLESQAAGVPVIAYNVGGVSETMIDGVTGRLVQEDTPEALAAAILSVLADPEWRKTAAQKGRAFVSERFGIDQMITNLQNILLNHQSDAPSATSSANGGNRNSNSRSRNQLIFSS